MYDSRSLFTILIAVNMGVMENNSRYKHAESKYDFKSIWGFRCHFRPDISAYWSVDLCGNLEVVLDGDYNAKLNIDLMSIDIGIDVTNGPFSVDL